MINGTVQFDRQTRIFGSNQSAIINGRTSLEFWIEGPWVCVRDNAKPQLGRVKIHGSRCTILEPDWREDLDSEVQASADAAVKDYAEAAAPKKPGRPRKTEAA